MSDRLFHQVAARIRGCWCYDASKDELIGEPVMRCQECDLLLRLAQHTRTCHLLIADLEQALRASNLKRRAATGQDGG